MSNEMIVIEVPQNLKHLANAFSKLIDKVTSTVKRNAGGCAVAYEAVEADFEEATSAVERAAHEATLASLDIDALRITVGDAVYNRLGRHEGVYYSLAGELRVLRTLYRKAGVRNGEVLDPIAMKVGAFGNGWLPKASREISFLMQQGTEREAHSTAAELGRLPYSASTFKRIAHVYGQQYREGRADIEDLLIEEFVIPDDAAAVSISLDRVSIPMEEPRERPRGRPRKDAPKRWVTRKFRMAWCGTVTLHNKEGEAVETIRYGAMPNADPGNLCGRMAVDTHKLLEKRGVLKVVLLADGAHELWNLLESHFPEAVFGKTIRLVDFWHLIEKLAPAAKLIQGDDASQMTLARWKQRLRHRAGAVDEILAELFESGLEEHRVENSRPVHDAITYLTNHRDRMNYARARDVGLPIGSGNVEATCKSLFAIRMKRPGSRWHEDTGEDIVQLRALALSNRWDPAMTRFLNERGTAVRVAG